MMKKFNNKKNNNYKKKINNQLNRIQIYNKKDNI